MRLRITWSGGSATFDPTETIQVGREPSATITIDAATISRAHIAFTFVNELWTFEDMSSNGTFIDGDRVTVGGIGGPITMHLGTPTGPALQIEPLVAAISTPPPPPVPDPVPVPPPTPGHGSGLDTVRFDDRALRLELGGTTHVYRPGQTVTVGRDATCDLQSDSQLVSARHCTFSHDGAHWWVEDLDSTRGTWIDHKRISRERVEGAFFVLMGDDDAGEPIRVVTSGVHRKPQDRRPLYIAGAALAAVLLGGLAALLFWPDQSENEVLIDDLRRQIAEQQRQTDEQIAAAEARAEAAIAEANAAGGAGNSPSELMRARLSTGFISVPDDDGFIVSTGSGALVSDDGLILTNIHVVLPGLEFERTGDPTFAGLDDPEQVIVAFPSTDGGPADLLFVAEQYDAHPAHDAALIRIVEGIEGASLDDLPAALPLGQSGDLRAGDQIAVVGYPGTAFTERVSVALSNFQSFQPCVAGSFFDDGFGCLRNYDEGYLNLAGETLEGGSSGGPIVRKGEVVGIQLGTWGEPGASSAQNLGVPIDLIVEELLGESSG